uniref:Protein sleepless n=1 Tax=Ditylenchus dipsaci TaxID=166011 RepID=A0A915CX62_9BILA
MSISVILNALLLVKLFSVANSLNCYHCSHTNTVQARQKIYDRVETSPQLCDEVDYCQGKWCVQKLDGSNVTFSCAEWAILSDEIWDRSIDSQCRAFFGHDGVVHAVCYCRSEDYCNRAHSKNSNSVQIYTFLSVY